MRSWLWAMLVLLLAAVASADTTVALRAGYNAVGFQSPRVAVSPNPAVLGAFRWDGTAYVQGPATDGRLAYWVYASSDTNLTYTGTNDGLGNFVDLPRAGYHFVSFATTVDVTLTVPSTVLPTFQEVQPDGSYRPVNVSAGGVVRPGRAYWVFASAPARLTWGAAATALTVTPPGAEVRRFSTTQFTATATLQDGSRRDVTADTVFTARDGSIVGFVAPGLAKGLNPGTTQVVASYGGREALANVTVTDFGIPGALPSPSPVGVTTIFACTFSGPNEVRSATATMAGSVFASGGGLNGPRGVAFGPDGNLFVSSDSTNQVLRYDGRTGAFLNVFATTAANPRSIVFRANEMFVASSGANRVQRFNATTGAFIDDFIPAGSGGLSFANGLGFSPLDGKLWVSSAGSQQILRYNADGTFDTVMANGINAPIQVAFSPSGDIVYLSTNTSQGVQSFDGTTGAALGRVGPAAPCSGLGVDFQGFLYVSAFSSSNVAQYSPAGALVRTIPMGSNLAELVVTQRFPTP